MRAKSPSGCQVVRKEQKGALLRAFVSRALARRELTGGDHEPICLIARSFESPSAQVLVSLASEIASLGLSVRTVITAIDNFDFGGEVAVGLRAPFTTEDTRIIRDPRLYDAHEQLILDATTTWVGDCMRREPAKTDAYERFAEDCPVTAKWARKSFASLWRAGRPTNFVHGASLSVVPIAETIDALTLHGQNIRGDVVTSATRH